MKTLEQMVKRWEDIGIDVDRIALWKAAEIGGELLAANTEKLDTAASMNARGLTKAQLWRDDKKHISLADEIPTPVFEWCGGDEFMHEGKLMVSVRALLNQNIIVRFGANSFCLLNDLWIKSGGENLHEGLFISSRGTAASPIILGLTNDADKHKGKRKSKIKTAADIALDKANKRKANRRYNKKQRLLKKIDNADKRKTELARLIDTGMLDEPGKVGRPLLTEEEYKISQARRKIQNRESQQRYRDKGRAVAAANGVVVADSTPDTAADVVELMGGKSTT